MEMERKYERFSSFGIGIPALLNFVTEKVRSDTTKAIKVGYKIDKGPNNQTSK